MRAIDWRSLRGSIALFVLALAMSAVASGGAVRFHDAASRSHDVQKQRLETMRARYRTIDEQRRLVESRLPEFRTLEAAGIIGEEQRLTWIETLQEVAAAVGLPSLRYRIEPRTPYETGLDLGSGAYRPFSSVVRVEAGLLHEGDFERLAHGLAMRNAGLYRVERCGLRRAAPSFVMRAGAVNLAAECDLRWITFARVKAPS